MMGVWGPCVRSVDREEAKTSRRLIERSSPSPPPSPSLHQLPQAPCILFIDEFDGVGKARSAHGGGDESVHTINQLLTELDGFDDNTGVVVFAASNRPQALDTAVTRPGRFDRIITLPLPNVQGRMEILKVHARGRTVSPDLDYRRIARATAGYTGAQLMNLMNNAAIAAARQGRAEIADEEVFEALEKLTKDAVRRRRRG